MQEFSVEFRISGVGLDSSAITATLGLEPSLTREVGDRRDEATRWEEAMWSYNGFSDPASEVTWPSLEDGLQFLLEKLWPARKALETYKQKYEMIFWCGCFQSDSNGSTSLSPDILAQLGEFGVGVFIDTYFSEQE